MKKIAFLLFIFCLVGIFSLTEGFSGESENGSKIFSQRGCAVCHDKFEDQTTWGLGPSLKQISEAYKDHEDDLTKFLKGGCKPIIDESRFEIMHGEIISINDLSDSQIEALVRFVYQGE